MQSSMGSCITGSRNYRQQSVINNDFTVHIFYFYLYALHLFTLYLAYPNVTVTPYVKSTLQETEKVNDFNKLMVYSRAGGLLAILR